MKEKFKISSLLIAASLSTLTNVVAMESKTKRHLSDEAIQLTTRNLSKDNVMSGKIAVLGLKQCQSPIIGSNGRDVLKLIAHCMKTFIVSANYLDTDAILLKKINGKTAEDLSRVWRLNLAG